MGIVVYHSLTAALKDGYQVYDKTPKGYLLRTRTARGYALAVLEIMP